ncbi:MAG: DedA family protein [Candidatus Zixiibacteriota bacterium]
MIESLAQINEYLDYVFRYGTIWVYLLLFVACFIENFFPPFPGDSFILAAGVLAALSRINPFLVYVLVISGGMLSVMLLYYFGRRYGYDFFVRKNYKYFSAADVVRVETKLQKYGAFILVASRFIVGFRTALAIGAGIGRYQAVKMFVYSLISYLVFGGMLMYIAFQLVENIEKIDYYVRTYNRIVWPVLLVLVMVFVVNRYRNYKKKRTR